MKIIKTTEYFGIAEEQAGKEIYSDMTKEEALVLDVGLEHHFIKNLETLNEILEEESYFKYIDRNKHDAIIFEFVADNSSHNKYCMVFK